MYKVEIMLNNINKNFSSGDVCTVCFDPIEGITDTLTLRCQHVFHNRCVMPWMKMKHTCPNCRQEQPISWSEWGRAKVIYAAQVAEEILSAYLEVIGPAFESDDVSSG